MNSKIKRGKFQMQYYNMYYYTQLHSLVIHLHWNAHLELSLPSMAIATILSFLHPWSAPSAMLILCTYVL